MRCDDLYGSKIFTVDELAEQISQVLDVEMVPHESDPYGDYFCTPGNSGETLSVQPNYVDYGEEEDEIIEDEFPEYPVIVRVNRTTRGDEIRLRLAKTVPTLDFLRRRPW
jgi:hypothetical protein